MNRKDFLKSSLILGGLLATGGPRTFAGKKKMTVRLIRHATLNVELGGLRLLVDPMLSAKEAMAPVQNAGNDIRIPMTDLPLSPQELNNLIAESDAVLVTHTHRDHWDAEAQAAIPKDKPVFCQPVDLEKIRESGFKNAVAIDKETAFRGLTIYRTSGQHGTGEIGQLMGAVSGFVISSGDDRLYISGDTIWCNEVSEAISSHRPTAVVVNAGAAQFLKGDPITMNLSDIDQVLKASGKAKVIAVHMDTVNHCQLHKTEVREFAKANGVDRRLLVPDDGEVVSV